MKSYSSFSWLTSFINWICLALPGDTNIDWIDGMYEIISTFLYPYLKSEQLINFFFFFGFWGSKIIYYFSIICSSLFAIVILCSMKNFWLNQSNSWMETGRNHENFKTFSSIYLRSTRFLPHFHQLVNDWWKTGEKNVVDIDGKSLKIHVNFLIGGILKKS